MLSRGIKEDSMKRDIKWMQWIALLIPLGGILYSAALVLRNDEDAAKEVGVVSAVSFCVQFIITVYIVMH